MSSRFGGFDMGSTFPAEHTLVVNKRNPLICKIAKLGEAKDSSDDMKIICRHIYDLAMMSHKQLEADEMTAFIQRSNEILVRLAELEDSKN